MAQPWEKYANSAAPAASTPASRYKAPAEPAEPVVQSGRNKGMNREQLEAQLRRQENLSANARIRAESPGTKMMEPVGVGLDLLGQGARTLLSPATGAVALAADSMFDKGKKYGGSYERARDAQIGQPAGATTRNLLRKASTSRIGQAADAALQPVGEWAEKGIGGIASALENVGLDEQTSRNVAAAGVDVGLEAIGLRAGGAGRATRPRPEAKGAEGSLKGREAGLDVPEKLPQGGRGSLGLARSYGFKIDPRTASLQAERQGKPQVGIIRQDLAGPGTPARFQVENQAAANRVAAESLGLDPKKPLRGEKIEGTNRHSGELQKVFDEHNAAANELATSVRQVTPDDTFRASADGIGARVRDNPALENNPSIERMRARLLNIEKMSGQQLLDAIKEMRAEAGVNFQSIGDFGKQQAGYALREGANALEGMLERAAEPFAKPGAIDAFRKSRVRAAQAHDIESALVGDNLNIAVLKNIGGEQLTGDLAALARIAEEFPTLTKTQSAISGGSYALTPSPWFPYRVAGRLAGRQAGDYLLSDAFQNQFGAQRGERIPMPAGKGNVPLGPAAFLEGGVDFTPTGGLPPGPAFRNPNRRGPDIEPDPVPNPEPLPPGGGRPGDLTAETPPAPRGDIDFEPQPRGIASELMLADDPPVFPGAKVPEEAALVEFASDQPFERRRLASEPYTGIERRNALGIPDLTAERQRVLDRPIGTKPNAGIADDLLADEQFADAVRGDTRANRLELHPDDQVPPALTDTELMQLQLATAEPQLPGPRAGFGTHPSTGQIAFNQDDLRALGYTDQEIAQLLGEG